MEQTGVKMASAKPPSFRPQDIDNRSFFLSLAETLAPCLFQCPTPTTSMNTSTGTVPVDYAIVVTKSPYRRLQVPTLANSDVDFSSLSFFHSTVALLEYSSREFVIMDGAVDLLSIVHACFWRNPSRARRLQVWQYEQFRVLRENHLFLDGLCIHSPPHKRTRGIWQSKAQTMLKSIFFKPTVRVIHEIVVIIKSLRSGCRMDGSIDGGGMCGGDVDRWSVA